MSDSLDNSQSFLGARIARWEYIFLVLVVVAGLGLRLWSSHGTPLHNDEIHYAYDYMSSVESDSLSSIRDVSCELLIERRSAHPSFGSLVSRWLWFLPLGWAFPWSSGFLRGFNILLGALTCFPVWGIARTLYGEKQGIAAAFLVAISPAMVWISHTVYLDGIFTFLIALMLLAAVFLSRRQGMVWGVLMGVIYGLIVSTKLSAPILFPAFVVALYFAPMGTPGKRRTCRMAIGMAAFLLVFLVLNDPGMYIDRIINPTDLNYTKAWNDPTTKQWIFSYLWMYVPPFLWGTPLTILAFCIFAFRGHFIHCRKFDFYLYGVLFSLTPLLLLHFSLLSGPHGYMPLHLMLCLLGCRIVEVRGWLLYLLITAHVGFCVTSIGLRNEARLPFTHHLLIYPKRSEKYTLTKDYLFDRKKNFGIVVVDDDSVLRHYGALVRQAQLAEGAIVYGSAKEAVLSEDLFRFADIVIWRKASTVTIEHLDLPDDFKMVDGSDQYVIFKRVAGESEKSFSTSDLIPSLNIEKTPPSEHDIYQLAGGIYPLSGSLWYGGNQINVMYELESGKVSLNGRRDAFHWGNGRLYVPKDFVLEGSFSIKPPVQRDIFWGF